MDKQFAAIRLHQLLEGLLVPGSGQADDFVLTLNINAVHSSPRLSDTDTMVRLYAFHNERHTLLLIDFLQQTSCERGFTTPDGNHLDDLSIIIFEMTDGVLYAVIFDVLHAGLSHLGPLVPFIQDQVHFM